MWIGSGHAHRHGNRSQDSSGVQQAPDPQVAIFHFCLFFNDDYSPFHHQADFAQIADLLIGATFYNQEIGQ